MNKFLIAVGMSLALMGPVSSGPAEPGTYYDHSVGANSDRYYKEWLLADGEETIIELIGNCGPGQDIDLWVYDEYNTLIGKSTSYGCYEWLSLTTHQNHMLTIRVENNNKPYRTSYDLKIW